MTIQEAIEVLEDRADRKLTFWHRGEDRPEVLEQALAALKVIEWIEKTYPKHLAGDKTMAGKAMDKFTQFLEEK